MFDQRYIFALSIQFSKVIVKSWKNKGLHFSKYLQGGNSRQNSTKHAHYYEGTQLLKHIYPYNSAVGCSATV